MKILQKIWDEFVYGSHLLALGDALSLYAIAIILGINITWVFPIIIYMSVLAINSFNRYKEFEQDIATNPERSARMRKYIKFFPIIIYSLLLSVALMVLLTAPTNALIFMGILFVIGLSYTLLFKGMTKKILGFKNFTIAIPYALMIVFLSLYYSAPINTTLIMVLIFYYMRIFLSAMFFDIKDIKADKKEGLKTFAVVLGKEKTIKTLNTLNLLSSAPIILGVYLHILPMFSLAILLTIPYAFYYYQKSMRDDIDRAFLYNVVADGEFIFWLPYILIGGSLL